MEVSKTIDNQTLATAAGVLLPYIGGISAQSLLAALKAYQSDEPVAAKPKLEHPLSRKETAALLGCSLNTINRYMNDGKLRRIKLTDRAVRIDPDSVRRLLQMPSENQPQSA